jgi:essential nuclear protein 1
MPKAATNKPRRALEDEYTVGILRNRKRNKSQDKEEEHEENFVDSRTSRKILDIGRQLAEEDAPPPQRIESASAFGFDSRYQDEGDDTELFEGEEVWADEDDDIIEHADVEIDDLHTFQKFFPGTDEDPLLTEGPWPTAQTNGNEAGEEQGTSTNLADLVRKFCINLGITCMLTLNS